METKRAVTVGRVSSDKQSILGDSFDDQVKQINQAITRIENLENIKIEVVKEFELTASANVELEKQPLVQAINYAIDPKNRISFIFVKSIDRATRAGAIVYGSLKNQLIKAGVKLIDSYGIINAKQVNTLEAYGREYTWSKYDPSAVTEYLEAERAKGEVRDILTRMIGAEINYTLKGYKMGQTNYGYQFELRDTPEGRRKVLVPFEDEAQFIRRMFKLRIENKLTDQEIVDDLNGIGFKTRTQKLRSKEDRRVIIGEKGGVELSLKQLQRYIENPIYCGVVTHKWLEDKTLRKSFDGLVTMDEFNLANRGRATLLIDGDNLKLVKGEIKPWLKKKNKNNPEFPFKRYVLCPLCRKPLYGSSPRSKVGKNIPRYHCNRNHKYWSVNRNEFNKTIENLVRQIHFSDKFWGRFRQIVLEEWDKRRIEVQDDNILLSKKVAEIESQQKQLMEKIKLVSSIMVIQHLEAEIKILEEKKESALEVKQEKELKKIDIEMVMNYVYYFLEHLEDLILLGSDPLKNAQFFSLLFEEPPTYEELVFGTPKLSPIIRLSEAFKKSESQMVTPLEFESRFAG